MFIYVFYNPVYIYIYYNIYIVQQSIIKCSIDRGVQRDEPINNI